MLPLCHILHLGSLFNRSKSLLSRYIVMFCWIAQGRVSWDTLQQASHCREKAVTSPLRIPPAKLYNDFIFSFRKVIGSRGSVLLLIPLAFMRRYICIGCCLTDALVLLVCKVSLKHRTLVGIPATKYPSQILFPSDNVLVCLLYVSPKYINWKISK